MLIEEENKFKIATWDCETTDLNAIYGYLLCISVKQYKGPTKTIRIDDKRNPNKESDKWVVEEAVKELSKYDMLVGWNIIEFDRPFLNTRAAVNGVRSIGPHYKRDLIYTSRGSFRFPSNKLKNVHFNILKITKKTFTTPKIKFAAIRGEKWALDFISRHCEIDVKETEDLYNTFKPYFGKKLIKK